MQDREPYDYKVHSLKGLNGGPSEWLKRFIPLFKPESAVLDLACGCGRNTGYIASWGHKVTALDIDPRVKPYVDTYPNTTFVLADIEKDGLPFKADTFDAVLINFYLYRPLLEKIPTIIKSGGFLVYETFTMPYEGYTGNRAKNKDFILEPLELIDKLRDQMDVLAYEETLSDEGSCFQRFFARKKGLKNQLPPVMP